jgi:hypothetical protein
VVLVVVPHCIDSINTDQDHLLSGDAPCIRTVFMHWQALNLLYYDMECFNYFLFISYGLYYKDHLQQEITFILGGAQQRRIFS